ncbi:NUDIX domain-containing protein [Deinococcus yavapaiensis]|uniref:ADP-ribose pyrophosphatase YjhB (NUDIX family) n=1 Tax=Deinococcus yavapaiensis KR-236 TaxID=694435 RepID=A0A318SBU4_9DEIO|nr:NUDIX domain-containing protein [Deinococcus yavapaiensis]PYE55834.1 ADP-ribose pyrophosphatase YjhB (NUDIX family) [Deinococcus yavapaiensis KR-236]
MDKPVVCVGALVKGPSGKWLIARTTKWRGHWGVPGGKVEYGEPFEAAVKREFREEVGLTLRDARFAQLQEAVLSPEFHKEAHFVLVDFLAETNDETVTPNEEIVEWAWVDLRAALTFDLNTYTRTLVEYALEHA